MRASGAHYGSAHFLLTVAVLVWLALRRPRAFDRVAAVLAISTFVGVAVFAFYPVAPPRLMPPGLATVDTLAVYGGLLSYDHGVLEHISDPLAALPSLHLAWATWVALALRVTTRGWARVAGLTHVVLTLVSVLVSGNHWYADALAGTALVLLVAAAVLLPGRRRVSRQGRTRPVGALPAADARTPAGTRPGRPAARVG